MKLLSAKYKTYEGARKRAAFENGVAPGEYRRGDKSRLYSYTVQEVEGMWRVARFIDEKRERAFDAALQAARDGEALIGNAREMR